MCVCVFLPPNGLGLAQGAGCGAFAFFFSERGLGGLPGGEVPRLRAVVRIPSKTTPITGEHSTQDVINIGEIMCFGVHRWS